MTTLLALVALVVLPLLVVGVAFKILFTLVLLPFKIVGALVKGLLGLCAGLLGLAAGGMGLLIGLVVTIAVAVLLPLAPLLLLGGVLWLALRLLRPATVQRPA